MRKFFWDTQRKIEDFKFVITAWIFFFCWSLRHLCWMFNLRFSFDFVFKMNFYEF